MTELRLTNFAKEITARMVENLEAQKQEVARLEEENAELRRIINELRGNER